MGLPLAQLVATFLAVVLFGYAVGRVSGADTAVRMLDDAGVPERLWIPVGCVDLVLAIGFFPGIVLRWPAAVTGVLAAGYFLTLLVLMLRRGSGRIGAPVVVLASASALVASILWTTDLRA